MRPPEFTGGNYLPGIVLHGSGYLASMRPPEFTGGNNGKREAPNNRAACGFNEAAGIHRRKLKDLVGDDEYILCFNEAAGIHRRKLWEAR